MIRRTVLLSLLVLMAGSVYAQVVVPTTTKSSLPSSPTAGTLNYVTDDVRGLWMYSATNSIGQAWFSLTGRVVNVEDFGAKGDGTTDSTQAFQNAAASMTGAVLFVPIGTYIVNDETTITGGVIGAGFGQSVIKVKSSSGFGDDEAVFHVTTEGTTFRDFSIDGNKSGNSGKRIFGIAFTGSASDAYVRRVHIKDMPALVANNQVYAGDGIYIATTAGRIDISDVRMTGCMRTGIAIIAGSDISISHARISAAELLGIDVEKDTDSQVIERLSFNDVEVDASTGPDNNKGGGISIDGLTTGSNFIKDVHLNNVTVRTSKLYGLRFISVDGALVTNTNVYDSSLVGSGWFANVYVYQRSKNIVFSGCRFANVASTYAPYGLSVENHSSVSNITVSGVQLGGATGPLDDPGKKTKGLILNATATWDPPSLGPGAAAATDITLTGAATTDACIGGLSSNTTTMIITCSVISSNTVRLNLFNPQTGTIDLASGTARVDLLR